MPQQRSDDHEPREGEWRERLQRELERVERERERLHHERERLRREVERLKRQLDEARRTAHRQAAPFAKPLVPHPRRPGRTPGRRYGVKACRRRPPRIDERYDAPLPSRCPHCGGTVRETRGAMQSQEALPVPRVVVRAFRVHIGRCHACRRRVQGRHPLQTSDALGAARAPLGAQGVAFAATEAVLL